MDTIRLAVDADGVAILTIDVPGRPMNVLTPELVAELGQAVVRIAGDPAIKGAIITSGKAAFLAGADLKDLGRRLRKGLTLAEALETIRDVSAVFRRLETCGKPVAAAINGTALGGGFELALACHYRVLADDPGIRVGLPEVTLGLLPGAGGTQRLPRLIGIAASLPLIAEGKRLKPAEALKLGLVHEAVPPAALINAARAWLQSRPQAAQPWDQKGFRVPGGAGAARPAIAQTFMAATALAAKATQRNLPAPLAILSAIFEGTQLPFDRGLAVESRYFATLLLDPAAGNIIRTAFIEKGLADKLARRPSGVPKQEVRKLGLLGAGMMGSGIAYAAARAGLDVVLLDVDEATARKGVEYCQGVADGQVRKGRLSPEQGQALVGRIRPTADYADLAGCELVIEAVIERRDVKADVTAKAEAVIPATAVFASNTSTLPITGLAKASKRPKRFLGLHFFSPAERMPLVEIILGRKTSPETLAHALDFVAQLGKTPIVVNDSRGFYTSRVFSTFCFEGLAMLEEGVTPALIENAARQAGMPVGPLAVSDEVSIELQWKIMKQEQADRGARFKPPVGYEVVRRFVEELKRPGRRLGAGFYEYPQGGRKHLWPGLASLYPRLTRQPSVTELKERFLYIQALETARCFEEGVIEHPAEADLGSLFGWGFPAYTGGTLSFIDTVGIGEFVARCQRLARAHGPRFRPSKWLRERAARGEPFHAAGSGAAPS